MKFIHLLLAFLLLACWVFFGNYPGPGGIPVPALGEFINPAQGFWQNTEADFRNDQQSMSFDHPLAGGDIYFDERGVPHIFADNLEQACFLQGLVHASDRLWQMDISTRATEGRLSEVLGTRTLNRDKDQVRKGYRLAAQRTIDTMRLQFPEDFRYLEAYSAGINAWIDQLTPEDYPVEYKILDHSPIRWSPYRTALLMKGMAQSLSSRHADGRATKTKIDFGDTLFNTLYPERYPRDSPIVPDDGRYTPTSTSTAFAPTIAPAAAPKFSNAPFSDWEKNAADTDLAAYTLMPLHPDNGSNNWAISGQRSNTGQPLLASDPHLSLTLPSIWSEVQIHYPGVNARGVGLPGAPGIMIGFNDHVAYGETNVGHDVTDWFAIEWTDEQRTHYLLDSSEVAARLVRDTVHIKGQTSEVLTTPWTIFGPVPYTEGVYADHAMRYLAHDAPGSTHRSHTIVQTFLGLMAATDYEDYNKALSGYVDPAQNFVFAAADGDIAIRPNGFFPLRNQGNGRFLLKGDKATNNWRGYVPFAERPLHYNPERGFVSSANQRTTGPDYPYPYYSGGFEKYRGRYINRRLAKEPIMNQRKMKELQLSSYSLLAEELTPLLIARINRSALTEDGTHLLRLISEWDYRCEGDSRAATLFERWRRKVYGLTFDEIPRDSGYLFPEVWKWNDLLREDPGNDIFDIDSTENFLETAATLTQRAFDEIIEELDGEQPETWAEYRNTRVRHLGAIPGFGSDLITTGGARFAPRALSSGHGASWRMVVELGPQPRAWGTLPGGASGDPASPYYDNGLDDWEQGRYHELIRWKDTEEAASKASGHWSLR
ncbi:MAG: penicillin acylase family protein [Bacteroidota bacterium]